MINVSHVQVALVCVGLCIRGLGPALSQSKSDTHIDEEAQQRLFIGLASLLFASIAYSLLGVIYQTLVSTGDDPPSHSDIMLQSSIIGEHPDLSGHSTYRDQSLHVYQRSQQSVHKLLFRTLTQGVRVSG